MVDTHRNSNVTDKLRMMMMMMISITSFFIRWSKWIKFLLTAYLLNSATHTLCSSARNSVYQSINGISKQVSK